MYCRHCGKEISGESKYCGFCGGAQFEKTRTHNYNNKAVICFFVSIIVHIMLMVAAYMKLVNVDFYISGSMWDYSLQTKVLSIGAIDVLENSDTLKFFCEMSEPLNKYISNITQGILGVPSCNTIVVIYMLFYLTRYTYTGRNNKKSVFGQHFRKFSCIPSIMMSVLVIFILSFGNIGTDERFYIGVKPAIGSVIIIICTIIQIAINIISYDCRKESDDTETYSASVPNHSEVTDERADGVWYCYACGTANRPESRICYKCRKWRDS